MKTEIGKKLGHKLRKLRMDSNYTQEYLAEVLGVSQKTYSNMENNKTAISADKLQKIAEEYGIDMAELLQDGKIVVQHNNSHDTSTFNGVFNNYSEKLIEQYEARIEELKEQIKGLKEQNALLKDLLEK